MTVIAGVRTAGGVLLAADRAAVDPCRRAAPDVYADAGDRTKLVTSPGGVAVALAGCAGTGEASDGEAADLLIAVRDVIADVSDGAIAAVQVRRLFDRAAPAIRRYAEPLGAPSVLPSFERAVRAIALVSGPEPGGPRLTAVGLTTEGDCLQMDVDGPGTAYGPGGTSLELERAVVDAAGGATERVVERIGAAVVAVSQRTPNLVSLDWDSVLVGTGGAGAVREHRLPRQVVVPRY